MEGFQLTAKRFINTTRSHIFLTGKAGTGKTTFLKNLKEFTHKSFIVVAPTGIAALNAGGVTIHSQFLLPFGMFIPERYSSGDYERTPFYSQETLAKNHPLNSVRKQVLRSIDLLVIDEVSMLRADIVDAIDYRMRAARGNFADTFGGVQVLFIGDLYQLPPVVKREEEQILNKHYPSPWFYEARTLKQDPLVFIEFNKIFRQADQTFIELLNNIRNNAISRDDIDRLNSFYKSPEEISELKEVITLTTHNYKADDLNGRALKELPGKSYFFSAVVGGEFPESMFPVLERIELKVGAQIMFVRNDPEGQYFNGKLATVREISGTDVWVELATTQQKYKLKKERWENKKYALDDSNQELEEEIIGSFEQYPVKLAWSITVHKSQGLTFDKAIIDVGEAFADGQVYVALSRLRSLEGLILRNKISSHVISTDRNVAGFVSSNHKPEALDETMLLSQKIFLSKVIERTFDLAPIAKEFSYVIRSNHDTVHRTYSKSVLQPIVDAIENEKLNTAKFRRQLTDLLGSDSPLLLERLDKGTAYYRTFLFNRLKAILQHIAEIRNEKRVKTYVNQLNELDVLLMKKLEEVDKIKVLTQTILEGKDDFALGGLSATRATERNSLLKEIESLLPQIEGKAKKKKSKKKGEESTYDISLRMLQSGLKPAEIASQRELTLATIEGHLAKAVEAGKLEITTFVSPEILEQVANAIGANENVTFQELYRTFSGRYSYGILKAAMAHIDVKNTSSEV